MTASEVSRSLRSLPHQGISLALAGLTALGTVLPWVNVFGVAQWGLARPGGPFLLALAGLEAGFAWERWRRRRSAFWPSLAFGAAGTGIAVTEFKQTWQKAQAVADAFNTFLVAQGGPPELAVTGWRFLGGGLYLSALGQVSLAAVGLIGLRDLFSFHLLHYPFVWAQQVWHRLKVLVHPS